MGKFDPAFTHAEHIILSCGVQFEGNRGWGIPYRTMSLRLMRNYGDVMGSSTVLLFNYLGALTAWHCEKVSE